MFDITFILLVFVLMTFDFCLNWLWFIINQILIPLLLHVYETHFRKISWCYFYKFYVPVWKLWRKFDANVNGFWLVNMKKKHYVYELYRKTPCTQPLILFFCFSEKYFFLWMSMVSLRIKIIKQLNVRKFNIRF